MVRHICSETQLLLARHQHPGSHLLQVPCSFDASRLCGQESAAHRLQLRSKRAGGDGDVVVGGGGGGGRSTRSTSHLETALWSAARMRGGEIDRNRDVPQELAESAQSLQGPHDSAQPEEVRETIPGTAVSCRYLVPVYHKVAKTSAIPWRHDVVASADRCNSFY